MRRRTFLTTGWLNILGQIVLLAALYAFGSVSALGMAGPWAPYALLLLVGLPSALWTVFFYLQDRRKPEPAHAVILAFLAGMAAASVFALPIERDLFQTSAWLYESPALLILGSALVRGTLASFLVYLIIHLGFYPSRDFDEPADGMIYGAFAGAGFATITSLTYLAGHLDFTLFAIGYTAATNILMYASVGALVGHLVGRTKFSTRPRASVPRPRHRDRGRLDRSLSRGQRDRLAGRVDAGVLGFLRALGGTVGDRAGHRDGAHPPRLRGAGATSGQAILETRSPRLGRCRRPPARRWAPRICRDP